MSKRCPSCQAKVPDDARDCPYCPQSFGDADEEGQPGRSRRSHIPPAAKVGFIVLVVAGVGYFAWNSLEYVIKNADGQGSDYEFSSRKLSAGPKSRAQLAADGQLPAEKASGGGAASEDDQPPPPKKKSYSIYRDDEPKPEEQAVVMDGGRADAPEEKWRFRGTVYNIETLEPVSGVAMTFMDTDTNKRLRTVTDSRGRYRLTLAPLHLRGYSVKLTASGFAADYANPSLENIRKMSQEERYELSRELAQSVNGPSELDGSGGGVTDFYLAPLKR